MELNDDLFLHEKVWYSKVCKAAREVGLDWLRLCAAAEVLSDGNPRARNLDWDFIEEYIGPNNPVFSTMYDEQSRPSMDIIDRGTRWGLFQITGQVAIDNGHTGQLVNLTTPENNIKVICHLLIKNIKKVEIELEENPLLETTESIQHMAEERLGWPVELIDEKVNELKMQISNLLTFGD